jgi:hypothetical protein
MAARRSSYRAAPSTPATTTAESPSGRTASTVCPANTCWQRSRKRKRSGGRVNLLLTDPSEQKVAAHGGAPQGALGLAPMSDPQLPAAAVRASEPAHDKRIEPIGPGPRDRIRLGARGMNGETADAPALMSRYAPGFQGASPSKGHPEHPRAPALPNSFRPLQRAGTLHARAVRQHLLPTTPGPHRDLACLATTQAGQVALNAGLSDQVRYPREQ